jgi:hypothetical protein
MESCVELYRSLGDSLFESRMSLFRVSELTIKGVRMMSVLRRKHRHYVSPLRKGRFISAWALN